MFQWLSVFNGFELDAAAHVAAALGIDELAADRSRRLARAQEHGHAGVRTSAVSATACSRRCGPSPPSSSTPTGDRLDASTALAEWVATVTDLPVRRPVQRRRRAELDPPRARGGQLARRGDRGRPGRRRRSGGAVVRAAGGVLPARRATTSPTSCGRCSTSRRRRPAATARRCCARSMVSDAGATEPGAAAGVGRRDAAASTTIEPTGLGALMGWLSFAWRGDFESSVALCAASVARRTARPGHARHAARHRRARSLQPDRRHRRSARVDRPCRSKRPTAPTWRSPESPACSARRGASPTTEPDRSLELVRRALADIANVPALTRLTLPGSASRLLAQLDPRVAALGSARADRRHGLATIVRRPDPALLRGGPAPSGRPPGGDVGAGDDGGVADRAVPVDDGLRRPRSGGHRRGPPRCRSTASTCASARRSSRSPTVTTSIRCRSSVNSSTPVLPPDRDRRIRPLVRRSGRPCVVDRLVVVTDVVGRAVAHERRDAEGTASSVAPR